MHVLSATSMSHQVIYIIESMMMQVATTGHHIHNKETSNTYIIESMRLKTNIHICRIHVYLWGTPWKTFKGRHIDGQQDRQTETFSYSLHNQ